MNKLKQINVGEYPDDGTGDNLRDSFIKVNENSDKLDSDLKLINERIEKKSDKLNTYDKNEIDYKLSEKANTKTTYSKHQTDQAIAEYTYQKDVVYTKVQTDAIMKSKANVSDVYNRHSIDIKVNDLNEKLNDKLDKSDAYTSTEIDSKLGKKADAKDVYTKTTIDNKVYTLEHSISLKEDKGYSYSKEEVYTRKEVDDRIDINDSFTKDETRKLLNLKLDIIKYEEEEANQNQEIQTKLDTKVNKGDFESNNQKVTEELGKKADKINTYTKTEVDNIISNIDIPETDLSNYYDKSQTENLIDTKLEPIETQLTGLETNKANISDVFTKTEVEEELSKKENKGYGYSKTESDAKLNLKADSNNVYAKDETYSQVEANAKFVAKGEEGTIDAYTKDETNALLDNKENKGVSYPKAQTYSKTEADGKFAVKADIPTPIDAYTKVESDAKFAEKDNVYAKIDTFSSIQVMEMMSNKSDKKDTYTKTETDAKFALKGEGGGGTPVDAYTKTETDNKFETKANATSTYATKTTTYTKTESDAKFALKGEGGGGGGDLPANAVIPTNKDNVIQIGNKYDTTGSSSVGLIIDNKLVIKNSANLANLATSLKSDFKGNIIGNSNIVSNTSTEVNIFGSGNTAFGNRNLILGNYNTVNNLTAGTFAPTDNLNNSIVGWNNNLKNTGTANTAINSFILGNNNNGSDGKPYTGIVGFNNSISANNHQIDGRYSSFGIGYKNTIKSINRAFAIGYENTIARENVIVIGDKVSVGAETAGEAKQRVVIGGLETSTNKFQGSKVYEDGTLKVTKDLIIEGENLIMYDSTGNRYRITIDNGAFNIITTTAFSKYK